MNPYIGDRQLEPDDESECDACNDDGSTCMACGNESFIDCDPGEPNDPPEDSAP
jgi:hypothetical protein